MNDGAPDDSRGLDRPFLPDCLFQTYPAVSPRFRANIVTAPTALAQVVKNIPSANSHRCDLFAVPVP